MNLAIHSSFLVGEANSGDGREPPWGGQNGRRLISAVGVGAFLVAAAMPSLAQVTPPAKKLIEYGWDVPTPAQMSVELAAMEKRPFDGLIFRLGGGHNAFVTKPLEPAGFAEDERILPGLKFTRFRDNFVLIWGSPPADFDWFDDAQWGVIEANAKLLVSIALPGHVRGVCFDPEPYDFRLGFDIEPLIATVGKL